MNKELAILFSAMLFSVCTFAQKDQLKTLKRIYAKEKINDKEMAEYKAALAEAKPTLASATDADKVYINFYDAMLPILEVNEVMSKPENQSNPMLAMKYINGATISRLGEALPAVLDYEKQTGKQVYTKDIEETVSSFAPMLLNYAVLLGNQNKYKEAASVLYSIYQLNKKDADNLYYAANYALTGKDYEMALKYHNELKDLKYTGEGTVYMARSVLSDKDDTFPNKAERDKSVNVLKTHKLPREEKLPSKRGEIYKNIAVVLVEQGKKEEAKAALAEAKRENPNDMALQMAEADFYLGLNDTETYKKLVGEILQKNPNDADLVFNMGVLSMQANQNDEAEKHFKRSIEIDPKYVNGYINLAALKLKSEKRIVDEMNKLGTSDKDNKRFEVLKKERTDLFKSSLPYLEKAHELDANNQLIIDNLLSVYNFLEMTDKHKALKAKANR